jgi:hypothetical protein
VPDLPFFESWVDHWFAWCSANRLECILTIPGIDPHRGGTDWILRPVMIASRNDRRKYLSVAHAQRTARHTIDALRADHVSG